ncbi:MAG: 30S ribosomal protein S8e [Nanoarchaeota archaeon]
MARSTQRSKRKPSGGRYHAARTKRKFELARYPANTGLDKERKLKTIRIRGGSTKNVLLTVKEVNVSDGRGKTTKTDILNVIGNEANPNLVRRNIITKGAVVETKIGKVKITSRPGQEGAVNGLLLG